MTSLFVHDDHGGDKHIKTYQDAKIMLKIENFYYSTSNERDFCFRSKTFKMPFYETFYWSPEKVIKKFITFFKIQY